VKRFAWGGWSGCGVGERAVRGRGWAALLTPHASFLTACLLLSAFRPAFAQDSVSRAYDLERRGNYAQAAELYRGALQGKPGDVAALLGLERALTPLNRVAEMVPLVQAAIAARPQAAPVFAVGLRVYMAAGLTDRVEGLVQQWAKASPGDETPYREWAAAALQRRDRVTARRAYQLGRERIGKPDALAAEIAQLAILDEDWSTAAHEWAKAVRQLPGYRASAATTLDQAPERARADILRALDGETGREPARIAVDLRARWGDPAGALETLMRVLPPAAPQQIDALQAFLDEVRTQSSPPYLLAQARTLDALGDRWANPAQQARYRLDAARAYLAAGDGASARRMLGRIAGDTASGGAVAAGATATLIDLLVREGNVAEASARLEQYRASLPVEDYLRLRRAVALRWAQNGELARADSLLAADSSVEGLALSGRIRLYAGDLRGASERWRMAGPFAGSRAEATERARLLALIQPIAPDTVAQLGHAFQALDRGDTAAAARGLEQVAESLPAEGGRAEVRLFAGQLYAAARQDSVAERLLRAAVTRETPATAAAALLELGRLYLRVGRRDDARQALEQMILDYPTSALVPQGRRLLDQARHAVPDT
jgi:tetratricopeptide (TPR) repeat protein